MTKNDWQTDVAASRAWKGLRLGWLFAWVLLALPPLALAATTFNVTLDRDAITLGESVTMGLYFEGGGPQGAPTLPNIPDLDVSYIGPFSQTRIENGRRTDSVTHNYYVKPRKVGEFTIPALAVNVEGTTLTSKPLKLTVVQPSAPPPEAIKTGAQLAFLKVLLPRKEVYLGDTMTAEMQLYVNERVMNVAGFQWGPLTVDGFTLSQPKQDQAGQRRVQVGAAVYRMFRFPFTLRPIKTGTFPFGPLTATAVLQVPSRNRPRDMLEQFFGGGAENQQVSLATEPETIQALALPTQNVPPGFNGAVGNYSMTVSAGPTNVTAGDPVTVRVQISGRGALDALTLPEQPAWRDFKSFPPTSKVEPDPSNPFGLAGTKTFEQVVMPQNSDIKEIPAVAFSFFDPDTKAYRTLTQPAIPLLVRPSAAVAAPTVAAAAKAAPDNPRPSQDIVHIKPRFGAVAQLVAPLPLRPGFLWLQGVPIAFWAGLVIWRKRAEALANNPRLRRQREVARIIRDGLVELRQLAAANDSDKFFEALVRLLQEQIGERLNVPASAITEAVIEEHLKPRGVADALLTPLGELFQACNLARYAPIRSSQELAAMIPRLETVLQGLQGLNL